MKITVIGAGWLGLPLAEQLSKHGNELVGTTTSENKLSAIEQRGISSALFLASSDGLSGDLDQLFKTDLLFLNIPPGRRNPFVEKEFPIIINSIIDQAMHFGCRQVFFVSSTSVYGNTNAVVDEDMPVLPEKSSGKALALVEDALMDRKDLSVCILRCAGLVGPDREPGRWFSGRSNIAGGDTPVNMIHLDDVIAIVSKMIDLVDKGIFPAGIFNLCADYHPNKANFYTAQAQKLGLDPPGFLNGCAPHKIVSNKKVRDYLAYNFLRPNPLDF